MKRLLPKINISERLLKQEWLGVNLKTQKQEVVEKTAKKSKFSQKIKV
jgi:hypothetical protein